MTKTKKVKEPVDLKSVLGQLLPNKKIIVLVEGDEAFKIYRINIRTNTEAMGMIEAARTHERVHQIQRIKESGHHF